MIYARLAIAASIGLGGIWAGYSWRDYTALRAERLAAQDAKDRARLNRGSALSASTAFQERERHAEAKFRAARPAFTQAMREPVGQGCPAFADVAVPGAVLDGLRDAWGADSAGAPASGPGGALPGAGDSAGAAEPGPADGDDAGDHP